MKITLYWMLHLSLWFCSAHAFMKLGADGGRQRHGYRPWKGNGFTPIFDRSAVAINQTPSKQEVLDTSKSFPSLTRTVASGLAALMIAFHPLLPVHAATTSIPESSTINTNTVELSKGAIVVQSASDTLLKSTIDSKSLLKTLFVNRQELSASLGRIQTTISQELASPAWRDIQKEFLVVKGDLASSVQIIPPLDLKETIRDVASGKLNLIVNGELVNVAIQPSFGEKQDEVIISIKGIKGTKISPISFGTTEEDSLPRYGPIRSYFSRYEAFWNWWVTPYPSQYLLPNMQANNGDILLAGTAGTIWLIYLTSYMYYEYEKEQEIKKAEAKRQKTPPKPKKKLTPSEKPAPAQLAKDLETKNDASNGQSTVASNAVNDPDTTDGTVKSENIKARAPTDDTLSPPMNTEPSNPFITSGRNVSELVNLSSGEQLKIEVETKSISRRLGWIRFWRRKQ